LRKWADARPAKSASAEGAYRVSATARAQCRQADSADSAWCVRRSGSGAACASVPRSSTVVATHRRDHRNCQRHDSITEQFSGLFRGRYVQLCTELHPCPSEWKFRACLLRRQLPPRQPTQRSGTGTGRPGTVTGTKFPRVGPSRPPSLPPRRPCRATGGRTIQ
jgi:hypothetical protein